MRVCPKCGFELQSTSDGGFVCPNCHSKYRLKVKQPQSVQEQPTDEVNKTNGAEIPQEREKREHCENLDADLKVKSSQPVQEQTTDEVNKENRAETPQEREIRELRERLDAMERQQKSVSQRKRLNIADNKALVFVKNHWKIILPSVLLLIVFITLMCTLVGVRGIYVNVNDSDDFYDFDATSYRASSMFSDELEEGKWKVSGNKLILTVSDDDFGDMSMDFDFKRNGYGTIFIDDVKYRRVSIVGLKTTAQKVKIKFDPQNGEVARVAKLKIGNKLSSEIENPEREVLFQRLVYATQRTGRTFL